MNLTRIRASTWLTSIIKYHKKYKSKMTYGDQDLMNIYFHFHPGKNIRYKILFIFQIMNYYQELVP